MRRMSVNPDDLADQISGISQDSSPPKLGTAQLVESVLFVAAEPVTIAQLAKVLELSADAVEDALQQLQADCLGRGVRVQRTAEHVQLVTAPEAATVVGRFLGYERTARLS